MDLRKPRSEVSEEWILDLGLWVLHEFRRAIEDSYAGSPFRESFGATDFLNSGRGYLRGCTKLKNPDIHPSTDTAKIRETLETVKNPSDTPEVIPKE